MEVTSPRVRALLRQAQRTEESGKRKAAEQLYRQIVDEQPQAVDAWLGLARVSADDGARQDALREVLALDPNNRAARKLAGGASDGAAVTSAEPKKAQADSAQPASPLDGEDPFSQSRSWLDEATARRGEDGRPAAKAPTPPSPAQQPVAKAAQPQTVEIAAEAVAPAAEGEATLTCYRHPQRKTGLRCITCNRPICIKCANHTPVGYRCPQCIREAQDVFFSANVLDYLVVAIVTALLSLLAGLIAPRLGFFVIFIGPAVGALIGRIAFRAARRRHGRYLPHLVAAAVVLGALGPPLVGMLFGGFSLFGLLWPLVYAFLAASAAFYQVK